MIHALISGQTAKVAFIEGDDISFVDLTQPQHRIQASRGALSYIFSGATDVEQIEIKDYSDSFRPALTKYNFDRGLALFDIALTEDDELFRNDAIDAFEKIMKDDLSETQITNYIFAASNSDLPLDEDVDAIRETRPHFADFVKRVRDAQVHILKFAGALERAFNALSIPADTREFFRFRAIDSGAFRALVDAGSDQTHINDAIFRCYGYLRDVRDSRQIIQTWTNEFIHRDTARKLRHLEEEYERAEETSEFHSDRGVFLTFQNVIKQQEAIVERIRHQDLSAARKFADDLLRQQLSESSTEYAAKSLSKLAMSARQLGQHSLELDWAKKSAELAPDDGYAAGILADSYLLLYRLPEAETEFKRAKELGEDEFGRAGLGRVARAAGKYDDALRSFKAVIEAYAPGSAETWASYAETLRDLWRDEEALRAYNDAIAIHREQPVLECGRAAVLTDLGQIEAARSSYERVIRKWPDDPIGHCGYAETFKREGDLERALALYQSAAEQYPSSVIACCGVAETYRASGALEEARKAYDGAKARFPYSTSPVSGLGETLRDLRRYGDAIATFTEGDRHFPLHARLRNGLANSYKSAGEFDEALRQFERNVKDFPYNLYSLAGRANLLKLLGDYEAASEAYDRILLANPGYQFAKNAKASIYIAEGKFAEAVPLLKAADSLSNEESWSALHIRSVMLVRQGLFDEAEAVIKSGLACPFFKVRTQFETASSLLALKRGRAEEAIDAARDHRDYLSNIIVAHAFLRLGDAASAQQRLAAVNDNNPPKAVHLRNLLWKASKNTLTDEETIGEEEIEAILQAA